MIHPIFENTAKTVQYILLWVAYFILQTFALYNLVTLPIWAILADSLIHALLFAVLGILLWSVVRYGNYSVLNAYQQIINYVALAVLSISIWLAAGYWICNLIFGVEQSRQLITFLPTRGFIGLLIYLLIIQYFHFSLEKNKDNQQVDEMYIPTKIEPTRKADTELLERIAVKSGTKIHVVLVPEIVYLLADGDYVQIYTKEGKYLKEQTMKFFEEHLPDNQFVRVHRSVIVNVEMISRIELYEKQNQLLTLKNGQQIKTSPAGYKALRIALKL